MNFRRGRGREEPEINLIPMIDVLLVILIFLMVTTTFTRFAELKINLPTAEADAPAQLANEIHIAVDALGNYLLNRTAVPFRSVESLSEAMRRAAAGTKEPVIVINADAKASHQSVIHIMEAARLAGLTRITFATQGAAR
jgi:biopolymer transport protein ExbD